MTDPRAGDWAAVAGDPAWDERDERLRRDVLIGRFDDAATEYIDAVTNYLDPENQYTESRRNAMLRTLLDLVTVITDARAALIAEPPATLEHALLDAAGWDFGGYDRGLPVYRRSVPTPPPLPDPPAPSLRGWIVFVGIGLALAGVWLAWRMWS